MALVFWETVMFISAAMLIIGGLLASATIYNEPVRRSILRKMDRADRSPEVKAGKD